MRVKRIFAYLFIPILFFLRGYLCYPYHSESQILSKNNSKLQSDYGASELINYQKLDNSMIILLQNDAGETICLEMSKYLSLPFYKVSSVNTLQNDTFISAISDDFFTCTYKVTEDEIILFEQTRNANWLHHITFLLISWFVIFMFSNLLIK